MKHLLQRVLQMSRFHRIIRHLQHFLHILTRQRIATYSPAPYLCFRQYDNRRELTISLN